jgi:hypothetical protein
MGLLGWLWLASPFALIGLISRDPELLRLVAQHHRRCQIWGWSGVAMMVLGTILVPGWVGKLMFVVGTPLAGLAVWGRRDGGDEGGEHEPDVPPIDWDEFERSFRAYARRRGRPPRRPRTPSPG